MAWYFIFLIVLAALSGAGLLTFIVVINANAAKAKKKRRESDAPRKNVDAETLDVYVSKLRKMIRCKTIADGAHIEEFSRFRSVLKEEFPLLHERAELRVFGEDCLIYKISGKNATKNVMLMSHHDVVEADGEWKHPPFEGKIADGALWGRGAVDTKTPLFAELQAAEELLKEGFAFEGLDLYIGSSHNEEICGDGIPLAVEYFKASGIRFDVVLDEGGAVTTGMMPGVSRKSAMVAVHEKGRHVYECTAVNENKGHTGLNPSKSTTIDRMCKFIAEADSGKIFKEKFYPEVAATFEKHAPYMAYPMRLLFSNLNIFGGLLLKILPLVSNQVKSMLSTTMLFTTVRGGQSVQTQAKEVKATAFFRCVREEDLKEEVARLEEIAAKYGVSMKNILSDYCRPTSYDQKPFKVLEKVLNQDYPDVIVSPFLLTAGTDARHFTDVADSILRFAPIDLSKEQFASVHSPNENITVSNIGECVCFYKDFVIEIAK